MAFERTRLGGMGRAAVPLGALGATVGPVLDGFHTWSGTTWYTSPGWLRTVWWCPLLFGGAALAIGLSRPLLEGRAAPGARAAAGWLALDRTRLGLLHGALTAAGGWLVEVTLVHEGLFVHRTGELAGVAVWIPCLYFSASTAIGLLGSRLAA